MKWNDILAIPKRNDMARAYSTVVVLVLCLIYPSEFPYNHNIHLSIQYSSNVYLIFISFSSVCLMYSCSSLHLLSFNTNMIIWYKSSHLLLIKNLSVHCFIGCLSVYMMFDLFSFICSTEVPLFTAAARRALVVIKSKCLY